MQSLSMYLRLYLNRCFKKNWSKQMNKKEAIEKIKNIDTLNINDRVAGQQVDMVMKNQVLGIISLIDEPQKSCNTEVCGGVDRGNEAR